MDIARRCAYISNSYYNKGLKLAQEHNMTGAADNLKKSLQFNKRNTQARNLLGLIYYNIGEVADALVQWVLSLNMQPIGNDADRYLNEVQRQSGLLDSFEKTITRFNQALALCQSGTDDLAIIQLTKISESNKNYLRAHVLLGLLHMEIQNYGKAYKCFQKALNIDKGNTLALRCIDEIKTYMKQSKPSQKTIRDVIKPSKENKEKEDNRIVISEPYTEHKGWQIIGNILIGLLIGIASVAFIYLPVKEASISREYNKQVISVSQQLSKANNTIKQMEEEAAEKQGEIDNINEKLTGIDDEYLHKLSSFQKLAGASRALAGEDYTTAAQLYSQIDPDAITDIDDGSGASVEAYYKQLKDYFDDDGYVQLTRTGDRAYENGDYDTAINYYDLSIAVHPENPVAFYKKGLCYIKQNNRSAATELFTTIINDYPESSVAEMAKAERGY